MTTEETRSIVARAQAEDDDPALLSGTTARTTMFAFALLLVVGPMLYYIPEFHGWRDVVGWLVALLMAASSPLITLLVPRAEQERYRQALLDSEQNRAKMRGEMNELRAQALARRSTDQRTGGAS